MYPSNKFPQVQVAEPARHLGLSVFPLFAGAAAPPVEYVLANEGIAAGAVEVKEVSEGGSVPVLLVENTGEVRVLFLEGEELVGAKQNRILNTSVLVASHGTMKIPVSCVEQGRWRYRARGFGSSGHHSSPTLRYHLKRSVTGSVRAQRGHRSDQGKVWDEVARQQAALGTPSATSAMADTFEAYQGQMAEFRAKLQYVTGACGLAVAVGKKIVVVDLFDKPATCRKVWDRLLTGYVLDALEAEIRSRHAEADQVPSDQAEPERAAVTDVEQLLAAAAAMPWQKADPVGEGDEYRANQGDAVHASALTLGDATVHLSVVVAS